MKAFQIMKYNFIFKRFFNDKELWNIPENELLDLLGFPYCSEGEIEFKNSK